MTSQGTRDEDARGMIFDHVLKCAACRGRGVNEEINLACQMNLSVQSDKEVLISVRKAWFILAHWTQVDDMCG